MGTNVVFCGKAEVDLEPGNDKLPPKTFRLVDPNITKHLTARIRSEAEVQNISLKVRSVLKAVIPEQNCARYSSPVSVI